MMRSLIGYVRESNADDLTPDGQKRTILALAVRYGYDPDRVEWVSDWGESGRKLTRRGYLRVKDDIADGLVEAVFARSLDRLGRDADELARFETLAFAHGTRVFTEFDGERAKDPDLTNVIERRIPHLLAEEYSRVQRLRAKEGRGTRLRNMEAHRATCPNGPSCPDPLHHDGVGGYGTLPGEDLQAVLDAFREAGGYNGAARLLNERGVAPRRGTQWESTSVGRIVRRHRATVERDGVRLPKQRGKAGRRTLATHIFSGLLLCPHDSTVLTATYRSERSGRGVGYFCREGRAGALRCPEHGVIVHRTEHWTWDCPAGHELLRRDIVNDHPKPWSTGEGHILEWAKAVTKNVLGKNTVYRFTDDNTADQLRDKQAEALRLTEVYVKGRLPADLYEPRIAALDADIARMKAAIGTKETWLLGLQWDQPPEVLNARLHDLWSAVRLDESMRPVGAVWLHMPVTGELDQTTGDVIPDPDAQEVADGWFLEQPEAAEAVQQ